MSVQPPPKRIEPSSKPLPQWNAFYVLDPTHLNGVVPPLYLFMVIGLCLSVEHPLPMILACTVVTVANVGLATWVQQYGQTVTPFQRVEAVRLVFNAVADGILIILYIHEVPVWCLSLTGALLFSAIWSGRAALIAYSLHLAVLICAMLIAGQSLGPIAVLCSTYAMCAGVTLYFMTEVRKTIQHRTEASDLTLALRKEQYARDMADHRRKALASTHQLASSLAHEVNNPLFAVIGNLNFAKKQLIGTSFEDKTDLSDALDDATMAASTISQIIDQMRNLNLSKTQKQGVISDLNQVVNEAIRQIEQRLFESVEIERNLAPTRPIRAHIAQINQIVFNLVINANNAMADSRMSRQVIQVSTFTDRSGRVVLAVKDNGEGIPAENLVRIFTPFYTTRPGTGSGLGLMVVHSIVEDTGGRIDVESATGEGSTFTVRFPALEPDDIVELTTAPGSLQRTVKRRRILVVDDDKNVVRMLVRSLQEHDLVPCHSTAEADQILAQDHAFDLVLCDIVMPDETGIHWLERISKTRPDLIGRWVFLSGGALEAGMRDEIEASGRPLLLKPIDLQVLLDVISDMTERASPPTYNTAQRS